MLLHREAGDIDIATDARPAQIERVLNRSRIKNLPLGRKFGTILAVTRSGPVEITTFRRDNEYMDRRHPSSVSFVNDYLTDSARRDFTVNALYFDPVSAQVLDPQHGLRDLNAGLVRFVGHPKHRIEEDALRMLRGVRLATELGFRFEKNSLAAIKTRAKYIQDISGDRLKPELDRIIMHEDRVRGMRLLDETGLLQFVMPELWATRNHGHKSRMYHLEGSVLEHSLLALKNSAPDLNLRYAALYHDTGKPATATPKRKDEGLVNSYPRHEFVSADLVLELARRLRFSRPDRTEIHWLVQMHMKRHSFIKDMSDEKKAALALDPRFPKLAELWRADSMSNLRLVEGTVHPGKPEAWHEAQRIIRRMRKYSALLKKSLDGDMIMAVTGVRPGTRVARIKNLVAAQIIFGRVKNFRAAKKFLEKLRKIS